MINPLIGFGLALIYLFVVFLVFKIVTSKIIMREKFFVLGFLCLLFLGLHLTGGQSADIMLIMSGIYAVGLIAAAIQWARQA